MTKTYNITSIRQDFPILTTQVYNKPLVYLDNGATTQKPQAVINSIVNYYSTLNSNVHRGVHSLSQQATTAFDVARTTVQQFINAQHAHEIIFTKGATDSINTVATSWGFTNLHKGDVVLVSLMEHHSNIVPWQMVCNATGAVLKYITLNADLTLNLDSLDELLAQGNVKLVAITHTSNVLGITNNIAHIVSKVHKNGSLLLVDGCQTPQHMQVDVQFLAIDFYVFSAHKLYGPTGVGILYGKENLLNAMPPYQGGGGMISTVSLDNGTTYATLPHKFEAGTPNIEGNIALGAAINYVQSIGIDAIQNYEHDLVVYAQQQLLQLPEIILYAPTADKAGVLSFNMNNNHPFDVGTLLDKQGVAVRTGHHCCQPLMQHLGVAGTVRASFALYNTIEEIDVFIGALKKTISMLS
ncbi:MAG: cysteine desulfurase [Bacteroidia bacterium]|nr:cysteine desulfurase [Bacteroidia bacterium]